jgi:hypothetical protein
MPGSTPLPRDASQGRRARSHRPTRRPEVTSPAHAPSHDLRSGRPCSGQATPPVWVSVQPRSEKSRPRRTHHRRAHAWLAVHLRKAGAGVYPSIPVSTELLFTVRAAVVLLLAVLVGLVAASYHAIASCREWPSRRCYVADCAVGWALISLLARTGLPPPVFCGDPGNNVAFICVTRLL